MSHFLVPNVISKKPMGNYFWRLVYIKYIIIFSLFSLSCVTSLTRITPTEGFDLYDIKENFKRLNNIEDTNLKLDMICDNHDGNCSYVKEKLFKLDKIKFDSQAPVQIRTKDLQGQSIKILYKSEILWFLTLGLFPIIERKTDKIRYDLYGKNEKRIIKSFSYDAEQMTYVGWVAPFLGIASIPFFIAGYYEDVNVIPFKMQFLPYMTIQKFLSELQLIAKDPNFPFDLQGKKIYQEKPVLILINEKSQFLKEKIENKLRNFGFPIVSNNGKELKIIYDESKNESKDIPKKEIKLKSGIYTIIKLEINFIASPDTQIQITDVESGKIIENFSQNLLDTHYNGEISDYHYDKYINKIVDQIAFSIKMKSF